MNASPLTASYWTKVGLAVWSRVWDIFVLLVVFLLLKTLFRVATRRVFASLQAKAEKAGPGKSARLRTLEALASSTAYYILIFIAGVRFMQILGFDPTSVLATAGVAGLAVGFGAQRLVRDVINGFFILLEDQISVGDYVTIGSATGVVEEIGMRVTRIRDESGRLTTIANGDIALITNYSRGPYRIPIEFSVPADTDPARIEGIASSVARAVAKDPNLPPDIKLYGPIFADATKTTYRLDAPVPPANRVAAEAEIRAALKAELASRGIPQL
jgi:small conductance mechanosensitive channel